MSDLSLEAMEFIAELAIPSELDHSIFFMITFILTSLFARLVLFDPGDVIYSAGEEANYLFLILKGR